VALQHLPDTVIKQEQQGKGKTLAFFYYIYTKARLCYPKTQMLLITYVMRKGVWWFGVLDVVATSSKNNEYHYGRYE
jgi:hypothetical protein